VAGEFRLEQGGPRLQRQGVPGAVADGRRRRATREQGVEDGFGVRRGHDHLVPRLPGRILGRDDDDAGVVDGSPDERQRPVGGAGTGEQRRHRVGGVRTVDPEDGELGRGVADGDVTGDGRLAPLLGERFGPVRRRHTEQSFAGVVDGELRLDAPTWIEHERVPALAVGGGEVSRDGVVDVLDGVRTIDDDDAVSHLDDPHAVSNREMCPCRPTVLSHDGSAAAGLELGAVVGMQITEHWESVDGRWEKAPRSAVRARVGP
jgi:hypothetical protein